MPNVNQPRQDIKNPNMNPTPDTNRTGKVGSSSNDFEKPDRTRIDREGQDPEYPNVQGGKKQSDKNEPSRPYSSPGDKI